jgi:hypothetical protein
MKNKKINLFKIYFVTLFVSFLFCAFPAPLTHAYTCEFSGKNRDGKEGQYKLEMEGSAGSCFYMAQDEIDNSKKKAVIQNGRVVPGQWNCTDGTVLQGEDCYTYKKVYTAHKPTYDDGTEIDNQAFQNACQDQPTYFGMHYNYDPVFNACSAGIGCLDVIGDSGADRAAGGPTGLPIGDCRRVGAGTTTAGDVLGEDPTADKNKSSTNDDSTAGANQQAEDTLAGNVGDKPQSKCTVKTDSNPDGKEIKTNIINCTETSPDQIFGEILRTGIQALSVLVGIAAVGGIAWASVKYAKAEDNDGDVKEAKDLIRNVIIGLLFYVLMIAIVNWLVPGGVIG